MGRYVILGIHDRHVLTVEKNVARVRLFIGPKEKIVDEDFDLPVLPTAFPETLEVYQALLHPFIEARIAQLESPPQKAEKIEST